MTRRELAKKTIGALFGVSAIPAALEKPTVSACSTVRLPTLTLADWMKRNKTHPAVIEAYKIDWLPELSLTGKTNRWEAFENVRSAWLKQSTATA